MPLIEQVKDFTYKLSDGVTQSLLQRWLRCPASAYYRLCGLVPKVSSKYSEDGTMFHKAMEIIIKGIMDGSVSTKTIDAIDFKKECGEKLGWGTISPPDFFEREAKIKTTLCEYLNFWGAEDSDRILSPEYQVDVEFVGDRLRGKVDRIQRDKNGRLWIVEHKYKSRISTSADAEELLGLDFQCLFYILTVGIAFKEPVAGVLYDIVRDSQISPNRPDYIEHLTEDIRKRPSYYFLRYECVYPERIIQQFMYDLLDMLNGFRLFVERGKPGYLSYQCQYPFRCEYASICTGSDESLSGFRHEQPMSELT